MKIWIDLTNSPHVSFFAGMIRELSQQHELLLTCRHLANTIELLDLEGFEYTVIGRHYGKNKYLKSLGFFMRVMQLYIFLRNRNIDVAISHSSFNAPIVAKLLGVRNIYLNDNEYAFANRLSFPFATTVMAPEYLSLQKIIKQGAKKEKIIQYPGVKEGVYLWHYGGNILSDNQENRKKKVIFIRPEPWTAQYYEGKINFLDNLLTDLKDRFSIFLLPRGDAQRLHYRQECFRGVTVLERSISLISIMSKCDLFIGAGGTMTREAAVLGIPTISVYQDALLDVDSYLIDRGAMIHNSSPTADFVITFLKNKEKAMPDSELLHKGKKAYEMIKKVVLSGN